AARSRAGRRRGPLLAFSLYLTATDSPGDAGGAVVSDRRRAAHLRPGVLAHPGRARVAHRGHRHVHLSLRLRTVQYGHHVGGFDGAVRAGLDGVRRVPAAGGPRSSVDPLGEDGSLHGTLDGATSISDV